MNDAARGPIERTDKLDVAIIGAGHNGLVAAWYLRQAGLNVAVFERRDSVGGACITEELFDGYRVSSCAYVCWLLQPTVIRDLELHRLGFRYWELDPFTFSPFRDGRSITYWKDDAETEQSLTRLNAHDAAAYPHWNAFWERAANLIHPFFLRPPPSLDEVWQHARDLGETALLERLLTVPLAEICADYFDDTRVMATCVSVGEIGDPWVPGSAWMEAYFHCNIPSRFHYAVVAGGMGSITDAMARSAKQHGVSITTGAEVAEILIDEGRARGVRLADGREITASVVVSNADPKRTMLELVPEGSMATELLGQARRLWTRTSYLKFHSVMERLPDLSGYIGSDWDPHHAGYIKIAPSLEHYRDAHDQIRAGEPAREPVVHIQIPTVYDGTLTNRSGHVVSLWAQYAPPRLRSGSWEEHRDRVGEALIDYVGSFLPNFRSDIREWRLFTPDDLHQRVGLTDGNIRHLDTIPSQFLGQRGLAGNGYATGVPGLYLCGAGTHPGGEVTGAPGHNAAHAILRDLSESR
jgi:phytoene dehydrogenase-like protein